MFMLTLISILLVGSKHVVQDSQATEEYDEVECECVPTYLCLDNDIDKGTGVLDIRYESNECQNYFEVCCENPTRALPEAPLRQGCGYQSTMSARIVNAAGNTQFGELPWTLALVQREKGTGLRRYQCGASLIHPQVALTAAHCVTGKDVDKIIVRAGEWDSKTRSEPMAHHDSAVQEVVVHPNYDALSLKNDIALLFLAEAFQLTENVGVICLPQSTTESMSENCIASGWGKNAFEGGRYVSVLRKVELPVVPRKRCQKALRTTRLGKFFRLHRSFICAGGEENKDTCKGDGGSPLVCAIPGSNDRYVQMGIVSWGIGCGNTNIPGVYVNVALYAKWIDTQITSRNFDTSYYKYLNST